MVHQLHEPLASCLVGRLDQHGTDRVNAEGVLVALLPLDEMVVAAELLEHVGHDHGAAVGFVQEVGNLLALGASPKA
jgi:hypothetical protein